MGVRATLGTRSSATSHILWAEEVGAVMDPILQRGN